MARIVAVPPVVEARCSASFRRCLIAPTIRLRTAAASRKRTSAFAGWTLTSTSRGIAFDEQSRDRMPVGGQEIEIGAAQRAGERLVAHRAPVDEQELLRGVRPAIGRQAHAAGEPRALAPRVERDRIRGEIVAERLAKPLGEARFARARGRPVEARAEIGREREADLRRGHREPLDRIGRGQRLGAVGFEELEPRGRGGEQVARLDPRAGRRRRRARSRS